MDIIQVIGQDSMMLPEKRVIAALDHYPFYRIPLGEFDVGYPITDKTLGDETSYQEHQVYWQGCHNEIVTLARKFERDAVPIFLIPLRRSSYEHPQCINRFHTNYITTLRLALKRCKQGCTYKLLNLVY